MKLFIYFLIFIIPKLSFSYIYFEDAVFPELATSGRALAMGNAFIAKVDDDSSVFYNPAGLGTVRDWHFRLSNFYVELNKGWRDIASRGNIFDSLNNITDGFSIEGQRKLHEQKRGHVTNTRFHMMPNLTTRYFSLGFLYARNHRSRLSAIEGSLFEYAFREDIGPYLAFNFSFFGGVLKLGASGIYLKRKEFFGEGPATRQITTEDITFRRGKGFIVVGGLKLTLPIATLPTLAAKINNSSSDDFSARTGLVPEKIKQTIDVGFSITPQIGNTTRLHLEVNHKDIKDIFKNVSKKRKLGFGMEFDFGRVFFLRFGYGDSYGSGGVGIKGKEITLDLTAYAAKTSNSWEGKEDRRFVFTLSSFFF